MLRDCSFFLGMFNSIVFNRSRSQCPYFIAFYLYSRLALLVKNSVKIMKPGQGVLCFVLVLV